MQYLGINNMTTPREDGKKNGVSEVEAILIETFEELCCVSCRGTAQGFPCADGDKKCLKELNTQDPTWYKKFKEDIPSSTTAVPKENNTMTTPNQDTTAATEAAPGMMTKVGQFFKNNKTVIIGASALVAGVAAGMEYQKRYGVCPVQAGDTGLGGVDTLQM